MTTKGRLAVTTVALAVCFLLGLLLWPRVSGNQNLSAAEEFVLAADYWGVVAATWVTLVIYHIANSSGWNGRIESGWWRGVLYVPCFVATLGTAVWAVLSIHTLEEHLWALTAYFGVFVIWDSLMLSTKKIANDAVVRACEAKAKYWLFYVDVPTPLLFWAAYLVSSRVLVGLRVDGSVPAHELVMSGVIGTVLIGTVWDWLLDCVGSWHG